MCSYGAPLFESYSHEKRREKGSNFGVLVLANDGRHGASDEEAPPTNVKKKDLTKSQ